jgi:hypothetical protein
MVFKPRFTSEKHCREETIARAGGIADAACRENRELTADEQRRIDALLTTAEICLDLRERIPREPDDLLAYGRRSSAARIGLCLADIDGREMRRLP